MASLLINSLSIDTRQRKVVDLAHQVRRSEIPSRSIQHGRIRLFREYLRLFLVSTEVHH